MTARGRRVAATILGVLAFAALAAHINMPSAPGTHVVAAVAGVAIGLLFEFGLRWADRS